MVGVQDEDAIHGARQHRVRLVFLGRHRVAHAQEIGRIVEFVLRINERLADRIFVGHGGQRRHFRDHADRRDHALMRIGDVGGVVIERRQRADAAGHHRHRMRVAAEALEEPGHLLVHHRVAGDGVVEVGFLRRRRQFAVEQQVAGLQEVAVLGELLDRIAAIEQDAFVAVDIGDLGLAACRRGEAGVVGEHAALAVELGDVEHLRADGAVVDREVPVLVADGDGAGFLLGVRLGVHGRALDLAASGARENVRPGAETPGGASVIPAAFWVAPSLCALQDNAHREACRIDIDQAATTPTWKISRREY